MILYLEEQLEQAYRVYLSKIPEGSKALDIEKFRGMVEEDEELFEDGELTNKQAMIKAWDNIFYGKYRLIREKIDATT